MRLTDARIARGVFYVMFVGVAWITAGKCYAQRYLPPTFDEFLKQPTAFSKDERFRGYLSGAGEITLYTHACPSSVDALLRNADVTIEQLLAFGKSGRGQIIAMSEMMGVRENVGGALLTMARSKGCAPLSR